jgi:NAD(P)-dependent dehydrogenase (short-subunit alcohol dehydrogenase family)
MREFFVTTVMITGANRGIGLAMTRLALAQGHRVIATARVPENAADLHALSGDLTVRALDVTDEASLSAFAAATDEAIDLAVLNAGVLNSRGRLESDGESVAAWRDALVTNIAGPFFTARAILPHLLKSKAGKIAIISSQMGSSATAKGEAYAYRASKAGANNVAVNLAAELKPRGIAVGAYHPGWVRTDMGGQDADISVEESAEGLLTRFEALSMATTGVFESYAGKPLTY